MRPLASVLFILALCSGALLSGEEQSVRIYRHADPEMLGRAPDRSSIISVDLADFTRGMPAGLQSPEPTAYLVEAGVIRNLEDLTKNSGKGETQGLKVERLGPLTYRVEFPHWNIENVYRFDPPGPELESVIRDYYSNVYWREIVSGEYANNYTVTVIQAVDLLNPRGTIDYTEVLLAAALVASREQPLWGIHDGLGLLDGLGYALTEAENERAHETHNYREYLTNSRKMRELVLRLLQSGTELSSAVHSVVGSLIQFEKDETLLLPEELIEKGEGDCLEFALFYYDILRRLGCEAKILALEAEGDYEGDLPCDFVTVYRKEEFGPWGYIHYAGYGPASFDTWEEIPGHILRDSAYYYSIDPLECMRERSVYLPHRDIWSVSKY